MERKWESLDLSSVFRGGLSIKLLRVELPADRGIPFSIVRYASRKGGRWIEEEYGLRLDLDKRVFIDHFDDRGSERYLRQRAKKIVDHIASMIMI